MSTATMTPKLMKKLQKKSDWPPTIFACSLEDELRRKLGEDFSVNSIAAHIDVTPITMRRILAGKGVSLENAMQLAALVGKKIEQLWTLR